MFVLSVLHECWDLTQILMCVEVCYSLSLLFIPLSLQAGPPCVISHLSALLPSQHTQPQNYRPSLYASINS